LYTIILVALSGTLTCKPKFDINSVRVTPLARNDVSKLVARFAALTWS
jgi:hypothetical protein